MAGDFESRYSSVPGSQHIAFVASNRRAAAKSKMISEDSQPQAETIASKLKDKAKPSCLSKMAECKGGTRRALTGFNTYGR